jgi:ribosome-binding factor A
MSKSNKDVERVKSSIARNVKEIVSTEMTNENIGFMTITEVDVSSDHSYCKIYVSFLNNAKKSLETLNRGKGYVRSRLSKKVALRRVPEIQFVLDDSFQKEQKLEEALTKEETDLEKLKKLEDLF